MGDPQGSASQPTHTAGSQHHRALIGGGSGTRRVTSVFVKEGGQRGVVRRLEEGRCQLVGLQVWLF